MLAFHENFILSERRWDIQALCIGNFDGIHCGHQELLRQCRHLGGEASGLLTFSPHPRQITHPPGVPEISTLHEKKGLIQDYGMSHLFIQTFDESFSRLSSKDFLRHFIFPRFNPKFLVVGHDFSFGHRGQGGAKDLQELSPESCQVISVSPVLVAGQRVSSTCLLYTSPSPRD